MRQDFDRQLTKLNQELIALGALCENAIAMATKELMTGDRAFGVDMDKIKEEISEKEREIERLCLKLLLQQHPIAGDLRMISSAIKMITDMKRIGDQAEDIHEIVSLANIKPVDDMLKINDMATATIKMVTESIDAFVNKDIEMAKAVIISDDIVDNHFDRIKKSLIKLLSTSTHKGEYAIDLLMIAKYFERIGDHAVNIATWVIFSITGEHKEDAL